MPLHHRVYVILLRSTPQDKGQVHLYVGATGLTPEQRFQNHLNGNHAAGIVKRRGIRLMPELYDHLPVLSYKDAGALEIQTAKDLRAAGYKVTQYPNVLYQMLKP